MTRLNRAAALLATWLIVTLVPVAVGGPADAAVCVDETHAGDALTGHTGCDDVAPPQTTIATVDPTPTVLGYIRSKTVTFTFSGAYTDSDSGPISFECQLYNTATAPSVWDACTSPKTYDGLSADSTKKFTFRVRAIDDHDEAIAACDASATLFDVLCTGEEAVDDMDATPAIATFRIDTSPPNTFLDGEPVDSIRPDWPVVSDASPRLQLNSNEPAGFACTLNGKAYTPCTQGIVTLADLKGGSYVFLARAYDAAFNVDPTPVSTTFYVPTNLKKNKASGWQKHRKVGLFGNDYLSSSKVGQTLVVHGMKKVREVRLFAPTGPTYGKIEVRVGTSQWYTVDLYSKKPHKVAELLVRDEYSTDRSGDLQIRVKELGAGRTSVRIDALVARGDCTTCGSSD